MHIEVTNETAWRVPRTRLSVVARRAERLFKLPQGTHVHMVFVGDAAVRRLNRRAFRRNRPTDVLAFPLHALRPNRRMFRGLPKDPDGAVRLGDIVISVPTAERQARRLRHSVADEVVELFAHGLLHLLGYDHLQKRDKARMAAMAGRLL